MTISNISELEALQGRCVDGYTEDDVVSIGQTLMAAIDYIFAVVWDYFDELGGGGSSMEYLRDREGTFFQLPAAIHDLLFDDQPLDEVKLQQELSNLDQVPLSELPTHGLIECDSWGANFTYDYRLSEEADD